MPRVTKSLFIAAALPVLAVLAVLAVLCGAVPASAIECAPNGCTGFYVVHPKPYSYERYQSTTHGPDHDYTPMSFYDGHGGYTDAQWYWGGLTWRYGQPLYRGPYRADGW
jgi:hypothetical protein